MSIELAGAIVAVIAAYIIGRLGGRRAEARERDGRGGAPLGSAKRNSPATSAPPRRHQQTVNAPRSGRTLTSADIDHIRNIALAGHKIQAIKEHRALTGAGLKESKDYVEALIR